MSMSKIFKRARRDSTPSSSTQILPDASNSNTNQPQIRRSQRIQNGLLQDDDDTDSVRKDPVSTLLPEILAEVYKYCSNSDLCRARLVSSSWKNSVEEIWRKRVTIYFYKGDTVGVGSKGTSSLKELSVAIQNEEFDVSNRPLRRFKFFKFEFILRNYNARSILGGILNFCGSTVSHLEISDCVVENGDQFFRHFLSKFCNIRTLILTRLLIHPENSNKKRGYQTQTQNYILPVFKNLSHLKIDYTRIDFTKNTKLFQPPWLILLSAAPNLETLEVFDGNEIGGPMGFTIINVLRAVEMLSYEKKLKKLKHIHVCNDIIGLDNKFYDTLKRSLAEQSEALQRSSISLKSLKFDAYVNLFSTDALHRLKEPGGHEFIETLLKRFGTCDLQTLQFSTWIPFYPQFPPLIKGMSLENLSHLSLHSSLGKTIKSAEQMPNLKSLEIWNILPHTRATKELERNYKYLQYLPADHMAPELANDEDSCAEDPDYSPGIVVHDPHAADCKVKQPSTYNMPTEDDFDGYISYKPIFWEKPNPDASTGGQFKNLRHFRYESNSLFSNKFHSLSTWMPTLTSLEIHLTASDFVTVCDKLRSLQRLVILYNRDYSNEEERNSSSPIDDCAITGKRHNSKTLFVCSCNDFVPGHGRKQSLNWSYFCDMRQPPVKPNITYLQELQHFEMEGTRNSINVDTKFRKIDPENKEMDATCSYKTILYSRTIFLTDESVFDGFYKLPKLKYLNISAKLSNYTRKELFKRIPKCIIFWPVRPQDDRNYFSMQNFERNNVV